MLLVINSNKSCFWINRYKKARKIFYRLTVTKVVFECFHLASSKSCQKINSNKSCFWILALLQLLLLFHWINSNKSCFWMHFQLTYCSHQLWLTVTKVVFEFSSSQFLIVLRGRLTVTKVVFESASTSCIISCTTINSNKGCFKWT